MTTNRIIALTAACAAAVSSASAQFSLITVDTYTQEFIGYTAFDAAAQPAGWDTVFDGTPAFRGFSSSGAGVSIAGSSGGGITSGGLFSWGEELAGPAAGNSTFAWQGTGSTANMVTTVSFLNNTGTTLSALAISFDVFQWRQGAGGTGGGRASTLDLSGSANLTGLSAFNFTATAPGISNPAVGRVFGEAAPAAFTPDSSFNQTITGLNLADGETFSFSFTYDRGSGSGSAQGIAIDNFVLAIPEPAAYTALIGALVLGGALVRRRRGAKA